jgi:hypothetical protein
MRRQGLFPHGKAETAAEPRRDGASVASLVLVVCMLQAIVAGKAWIPGAQEIGPYSGKETTLLVVWLVSWAVLHFALRKRDLPIKPWAIGFLVAVGVATTLLWPPVFALLAGA